MIQVAFNNAQKYYLFPENWEELTQDQFIYFIYVLNNYEDIERAKLKIAQNFLNVPGRIFYNLRALNKFKTENEIEANTKWLADQYSQELFPYMEFLFEKSPIYVNLFKVFTVGGKTFYGPKDGYEDVTIGEIEEADQHYQMFVATSEKTHLIKLVATLYRQKKAKGLFSREMERKPFDLKSLDNDIEYIEKTPENLLLAVKFLYERILAWYAAHPIYKELFKAGEGDADIKGWSRIVRGLSGEKLGNIEAVRKMQFYQALDQMFFAQKEVEELENLKK